MQDAAGAAAAAGGAAAYSRDQWRQWTDEKQALIRAHNEEKQELLAEMRSLRKAMNPATEQVSKTLADPI